MSLREWPIRSIRMRMDLFFPIAVQADGKILAGGDFDSYRWTDARPHRAAQCRTGLADSFDPNATSSVYSIAVQADGKILVGVTLALRLRPNSLAGRCATASPGWKKMAGSTRR